MIPVVNSEDPANGRFMETAGIEPAICAHRELTRFGLVESGRMQGKDGAAPIARSAPDTEGVASMRPDPIPVPLRNRSGATIAYAVLDAADAELAKQRWYLDRGHAARGGQPYARSTRDPSVYLHRAVLGLLPGDPLKGDHVNGYTLDCRRANLRIVTDAQNAQNQGSRGGSSQFRGVTWDKARGKWMATGMLNGRHKTIGRFDSEQEAADAASSWRAEHMPFSAEAAA